MRTFARFGKVTMETLIIAAGIIGFFLLLAVTITLVKLNWSEKTLAPVLSILLVGTATTLVTITVPLKKSTIESAFAASVVLDTSQGVVPFEIPRAADDKATAQLSELAKLARPVVNSGGKGTITIKYPTTDNERFTFCTELLQYRLLHIIADLQHEGWKAGYSFGASAASVHTPMKLPDNQHFWLLSPAIDFQTAISNDSTGSTLVFNCPKKQNSVCSPYLLPEVGSMS
jgi:hypothetical protein